MAALRKIESKRYVARWQKHEIDIVVSAVMNGLDLGQTHALLPYRTMHSVKDQYYRVREPQDRDEPAALSDAHRQKDAREGSARLLQAMIDAGLYQRKVA